MLADFKTTVAARLGVVNGSGRAVTVEIFSNVVAGVFLMGDALKKNSRRQTERELRELRTVFMRGIEFPDDDLFSLIPGDYRD